MFLKWVLLLCNPIFYKLIIIPNTFNRDKINCKLVKINKKEKKNSGCDERFFIKPVCNNTEINNIIQFFNKKIQLDILQNPNVSIYTKIEMLKYRKFIEPYNIFAGGLMNHFDFEDF
jgi:hypothetical protein